MNIQAKKLKLVELLLKTESETVLEKIKNILKTAQKETSIPARKNKRRKETKNGNKSGFDFRWEGGLKELGNKYDGVKLQHHINSLRK